MSSDSFLLVVPDLKSGHFDVCMSYVKHAPEGDDHVAISVETTTIRLGLQGLLALKVQIESAILIAKGEDFVSDIKILVMGSDHDPLLVDTWHYDDALDIARVKWGLDPRTLPPEAVAVEMVIPDEAPALETRS